MSEAVAFDLKHMLVSNASFGPNEIKQIHEAINSDYLQFGVLRDSVQELETNEDRSPAMSAKLGVCYYLLGKFRLAAETLAKADSGALAFYYLGKSQAALADYDAALESFEKAKAAGYNADECALAIAEVQRNKGNYEAAMTTLDNLFGPVEQTAEYRYQRGATVAAIGDNPREAIALYERALEADPNHVGALFGLGLENDRRGNDEVALRHYQRSASRWPTHVGSLLNLGLLYEDRDDFEKALACYRRILDTYPNEPRARLFVKDAQASGDMFYDEEAQRKRDRLSQVLSVPVTDFELTVRSRNCLQKMGIHTLGDLTRCTEQELLASKNFGETSLTEIREMLSSKGLELGQFAHERAEPEPAIDPTSLSPDEQALLDRPISDLNLSVRARKCMVRLGLQTVGELLRKTGDDLLECKNFGVTSLNEVREKLSEHGLKLRGE